MAGKAKELQIADFKFVDAWHCDKNGVASSWMRIECSEIPRYQQDTALNYNCFASVQRFANETKTQGEDFISPLYFDLDYKDDPAVSQADAIKLIDFFMTELAVQPSDIWVYFSGSKGFHILISSVAVGIEPNNYLHKVFKHMAGYLIHRLDLRALDLAVYTAPRMLRLANSVHAATNKYKIELSIEELKTMTLEQIKEVANAPRKNAAFTREERTENASVRPRLQEFYHNKRDEQQQAAATASARYEKEKYRFSRDSLPACVEDILTNGWKKEGDRNQATIQLACYFKDAGYTKDEALSKLEAWVTSHTSAKSKYQVQQRVANTRSVVDSVFCQDNEYKFGCAFIRSLHGEKKPGSREYNRVACSGDLCPCLGEEENAEPPINLHLAQTGDASLTGKLVRCKVMVAGKKHTPYIVPKKIEYDCWGHKKCQKKHCPLYDIPTHTAYKMLGVGNRELIQMTGTADDNIKGIIRSMSGIPDCPKFDMNVIETTNVEELLVIPMAEEITEQEQLIDEAMGGRYVLRKVYSLGGVDVSENKYYELDGYVYAHPKNQESTILIKEARALQDVVSSFKLTPETKELLQVFRPDDYTPQAIEQKLSSILQDLTYNVTHIVHRDETLLAVLLVQHSVLRFMVPWDSKPLRGWAEAMIVGDTSTGKSAMVEKLLRFSGLGTRVNAESTSRTGLTYKMEQSGSGGAWYIVWGAWPLADKELIWIDEATGITKDEYGEMTLARSDGKLEVKRAVTAETPCRVRGILTGNVPKGKMLADYGQGVESLRDIFNNEDIRRFDMAVFMKASDVAPEAYNQQLPTFPSIVTSEAYKTNVLFAWSRKPDDVILPADTVDRILEVATELSKVYGNAADIPLVNPADQRNKIARLSVALAVLTHSTDESGQRIVVWPGHVTFIGEYLKMLYNAPGCGLNYYAKLAIKESEMTEERYNKISRDLRTIDTLKSDTKFFEFVRLFAQQRYLRLGDVEAMLSIDKEESKTIVNMLAKMRMIEMTSGGYRKTSRFNAYIAYCFKLGIFDNMEDDY